MTIQRIEVISVPVSDQQAAKRFYGDVLGFELMRDNPMGPDQRWVQMRPRGADTSITLVTWFDSMPAGSLQGAVLATHDIDRARSGLVDNGVSVSEPEDAPWGRFATFSDPDGNGWVLLQAPA
jgi:catechol 2,3-dioxygenase-like lactoylglutathione lyase family enzyme